MTYGWRLNKKSSTLYMHIYILLVIVGRNWPPENERGGLVTLHYWSLFSIYAFYFNLYWSIYGLPLGLWLVYKPTFQAAHLQFTGCDFSFPIFHNKKQIHFSHTHTHTTIQMKVPINWELSSPHYLRVIPVILLP